MFQRSEIVQYHLTVFLRLVQVAACIRTSFLLSTVSLCVCATVCLFTLMDTGCFHLSAVVTVWVPAFSSPGCMPGWHRGIAMVILCVTFRGVTSYSVSVKAPPFHVPTKCAEGPVLHILANMHFPFINHRHLRNYEVGLTVVLIFIFLMTNNTVHLCVLLLVSWFFLAWQSSHVFGLSVYLCVSICVCIFLSSSEVCFYRF